jgi:glycosyltransferase involved in cell wall biosynthesis
MHTSVVILSYRPGAWLADAVASVVDRADEVLVVDNGSEGAEASGIARRAGAEVVRSETNRGFTGGVNLGVARARGEVVGLLNDDAVAGPDWLGAATARLADPGVAAVAPRVLLAGTWREVVLGDDDRLVPGDPRPLGRMVRSVPGTRRSSSPRTTSRQVPACTRSRGTGTTGGGGPPGAAPGTCGPDRRPRCGSTTRWPRRDRRSG